MIQAAKKKVLVDAIYDVNDELAEADGTVNDLEYTFL